MEETVQGKADIMWRHLLLSALLLWAPGVGSAYVEQLPFLTGVPGESQTLQCTLKETSHYWMYWYWQKEAEELGQLFYSSGDGSGTNFTAEPMSAWRKNNNWHLQWKNLSWSDSAVYYCACSTAQ
ncbi:Tesmin [Platysternon megacephalum]|uniref:Tesmin n=1 Tax=Platysternon megacephalum TaxID=55544 RepID=A0A4D9DKD3_9SAUR|nr:Tesmin [Platysternon megacephalum]